MFAALCFIGAAAAISIKAQPPQLKSTLELRGGKLGKDSSTEVAQTCSDTAWRQAWQKGLSIFYTN